MVEPIPPRRRALEHLLNRLGFKDPAWLEQLRWDLLDQALIHPSLDGQRNNDRLEFLGDSVLRILATEFLFQSYPHLSVGELTAVRSDLISDAHLAELADLHGLERYLEVGASSQNDLAGRERRLADAFEAVLGSLYLSWGMHTLARLHPWLDPYFRQRVEQWFQDPTRRNPKAALQELTQRLWGTLPEYRLVAAREHPPHFTMEVWGHGQCWGRGEGRSKKAAEMAAAAQAYGHLQSQEIR
ncbi:ribonuclease III [Synechococcus sp. W60.2]|uniref:ribonuclease III n=1 Tax=unclassified Synechococcus TaxID=2626047 RepID=UPI0039C1FDD5